MLKVLTAAQMREVDRLTTERYGIPSITLMENAAHAVARVITEKLGGSVEGKDIIVLCGKGNNGGDGAAIARLLAEAGGIVAVEIFVEVAETSGDARTNFDRLSNLPNVTIKEMRAEMDDHGVEEWIARSDYDYADVVVDAMFGTGLTRPLNEFHAEQVDVLNTWRKRYGGRPLMVAVDIPSGLSADAAEEIGACIYADVTVTFTAPKLANVLPLAARCTGELQVADIGSPEELLDEQRSMLFLAERSDATDWLSKTEFSADSYKNKRGHALMIAGSRDYSGAAVLCGDAAIRSGCGLVTIATPEGSREGIVARVSPEVMVRGISETANGSAAEKAVDEIKGFLKNVDVVAIGSGLSSKEDETKTFIRRIVEERQTPVLIDADGLTASSPWKFDGGAADCGSAGEPPAVRPLILTPHEGEFRKLLGVEKEEFDELIKDRVIAVREFATTHDVILVLKGERALIGSPDARVVVNPTGNSGLGKAGNGDTLTGILAGFLAQGLQMKIDIFDTVVAAVYVAGMAGDIAEKKFGKRVMTASDVRECLVDVFAELTGQQ